MCACHRVGPVRTCKGHLTPSAFYPLERRGCFSIVSPLRFPFLHNAQAVSTHGGPVAVPCCSVTSFVTSFVTRKVFVMNYELRISFVIITRPRNAFVTITKKKTTSHASRYKNA